MLTRRSGRNVPSVSMYKALLSPPPLSMGNWQATQSVWQSCVFPQRNSPKISVICPVSMPPPRRPSSCADPVVICTMFLRICNISAALTIRMGTNCLAAAMIRAAFWSPIPLTSVNFRSGMNAIVSTQWIPCSNKALRSVLERLAPRLSTDAHNISSLVIPGSSTAPWSSATSCSCCGAGAATTACAAPPLPPPSASAARRWRLGCLCAPCCSMASYDRPMRRCRGGVGIGRSRAHP
mmetsp:Transcript_119745/g.344091  ORF Transcript_119745/g.344091 Transcript_119745/m.344091 type:complete len:237 (-) Transcript_119745:16-726(-)